MDIAELRELAGVHGPFASVYLPAHVGPSAWPALRRGLAEQGLDAEVLSALDAAGGRAVVAARSGLLVDTEPAWSVPAPVARVADLPYLLPLVPKRRVRESSLVGAGVALAERSTFDEFLFEMTRPEGLAVDGIDRCTELLRAGNVDALVIAEGRLGDRTVWVGGAARDQVAADPATLRALGMPVTRERADEALPMAALTIDAELAVVPDSVPLADGVGVLLRHP
jgi:hypothetical protein